MKTGKTRWTERVEWAGVAGLAVGVALAGAGCRGPKIAVAPAPGTTTVSRPFAGGAGQTQEAADADVASDLFNVKVTASGGGADAEAMASRARGSIEAALVAAGFRLDDSQADLHVSLSPSAEVFDQSGNYFVFNGAVDAEVVAARTGRLVGKQRFETRGKRTLDRAPALRALSDDVTAPAKTWIVTACQPDMTGLKAEIVTVYFGRLSTAAERAEYVRRFVNVVNGLREEGVLSCALVQEDAANRSQKYRIVCEAKRFPEGVLNRLAGIGDLKLRPSRPR